nr:integrase, catalytic region, zinc finger, CCHC-type, peptidase aspartic, catalytic [Tanacetum cinerariifolium]
MLAGLSRPFASGSGGTSGRQRVIVCYNCKGEGHMAKQCTKPKRKRDAEWFKDKNFLGMVKFGNDHVAKIMGYGDYQIRNVTISRVYYVEGLGHNLFSVGQFCDSVWK